MTRTPDARCTDCAADIEHDDERHQLLIDVAVRLADLAADEAAEN